MTASAIVVLLQENLLILAISTLVILTAVMGISIGMLVFRFGVKSLLQDKSLKIFGIYVRNVPYRGYNRWRSQKWNIKNTM